MTREEAIQVLQDMAMRFVPTDQYGDYDDPDPYEQAIDMAIEALQTEVVRCKDCRYWQEYQEGHYPNESCPWDKGETPDEDDYCSFGERREP